jgi:hypothetical protein
MFETMGGCEREGYAGKIGRVSVPRVLSVFMAGVLRVGEKMTRGDVWKGRWGPDHRSLFSPQEL